MIRFRSWAWQRPLARLALVAMLLLATLPTFGRLLGARADTVPALASPAWTALCTVAGLLTVALPASWGHGAHGDPAPAPAGHAGDYCAYCPLLAAVVLAVAGGLTGVLPRPQQAFGTEKSAPSRRASHPCGLGSRGPPLAS